jgi:hypothetical protein
MFRRGTVSFVLIFHDPDEALHGPGQIRVANSAARSLNQQLQTIGQHTIRINYDDTLSPTLLLHLSIGHIYMLQPNGTPPFDQSTLELTGYPAPNYFPNFSGLFDFSPAA